MRAHFNKFISLPARLNCYYHLFLPHSIWLWNALSNDLVADTDLVSLVVNLTLLFDVL